MGWTAREQGTEIYLERANEAIGMRRDTLANFNVAFNVSATDAAIVSKNMTALTWRGADHQRTISQGAKSVEVVANLMKYLLEFSLPAFPEENLVHATNGNFESYVCKNTTFSNTLSFAYFFTQNDRTHANFTSGYTLDDAYGDCALNPNCDMSAQYPIYTPGQSYYCAKHIGAFFGKVKFNDEFVDGLYVVASNEMETGEPAPTVFTMSSILQYAIVDGYLELALDAVTIEAGSSFFNSAFTGIVCVVLKFGSKYYTGTGWSTTRTTWRINMNQTGSPIHIPISTGLQGEITLEIQGVIGGGTTSAQNIYYPFYDLFIKELSLTHVRPESEYTYSDREKNNYITLLSTNFRDEISVNTNIATSLNNHISPSMLMNTTSGAASYIDYSLPGGITEQRRPEKDLLSRLAAYYGAARQQLKLEVTHPTDAPLARLKLNGINDGKTYLPLSESRDWREETCTIKCFESPE